MKAPFCRMCGTHALEMDLEQIRTLVPHSDKEKIFFFCNKQCSDKFLMRHPDYAKIADLRR